MIVTPNFTIFGRRYSLPLTTEYQLILDTATSLGYTLPSPGQQIMDNNKIYLLKQEGLWNELEVLYVFQRSSSESDFAKLNWKSPTQYRLTGTNQPTFNNANGFMGNGTNQYFQTGFIPSTMATKALVNNTSIFAGFYNAGTAGTIMGTRNNAMNNFMWQTGNAILQGSTLVHPGGATIGHTHIVKNGTTHNRYRDGVLNGTDTYTSTTLSSFELTLFGWNLAGTVGQFFNGGIRYIGMGSGSPMEAKQLKLYQIMNDIMI